MVRMIRDRRRCVFLGGGGGGLAGSSTIGGSELESDGVDGVAGVGVSMTGVTVGLGGTEEGGIF